MKMSKTKKICHLALGIALYVVLSATVKIPLVGHIQTDLGYVAFGAYLVIFGWQATIVGVIGCVIESLIFSGWFPIGWAAGQAFIGLMCGLWYRYSDRKPNPYKTVTRVAATMLAVFLGVGLIKTAIECGLYSIPFEIKFAKNSVAAVADAIPMVLGVFVGERLKKQFIKAE